MLQLEHPRYAFLKDQEKQQYLSDIKDFLLSEIKKWKTIYPPMKNIFKSMNLCDFDNLKVVIIWQDPYHWPGQAHGLSFSVPDWVEPPPSLKNIFKAIQHDYPWNDNDTGNLESRATQWILLLNSFLTVEANKPLSHSKIGRDQFTDQIIRQVSNHKEHVVFLLRWSFAQWKRELIDESKHVVLTAPHPSPLSAHRWFIDCGHFKITNEHLKTRWYKEINWST